MAQLTGNKIKDTYLGLLKTNGSGILTSGFQRITDGSGLGSQLYLSLTQIKFYDAYIFPNADGSADQVLSTDGSGALSWKDDANSGTVTSVALSVPTGLTVTNSPITTSGTIAIANTSGYSIPTDAKQTQWDTAYTNRITTATSPLSITTNTISLNTVPVSNGGTGATTLTGILLGNGTSAISSITSANDGYILTADGVGGYAFEVASGGDVNLSGTPLADQIAIWTDATTIKGDPTLTIDADHKIILYQPTGATDKNNYNIGGGNINTVTGTNNTGFGKNNLNSVTSGGNNVAIGFESLKANTTGNYNVVIGETLKLGNVSASVAIGYWSQRDALTGGSNTSVGFSSLSNGTATTACVGIGSYAGNNLRGVRSTAIGTNALSQAEGSYNTALGAYSLEGAITASGNTGTYNTAIGYEAGMKITSGSYNVVIGGDRGTSIATLSNRIIISDGAGNIRQTFNDSGAATFSGALSGTSATFSGSVTAGSSGQVFLTGNAGTSSIGMRFTNGGGNSFIGLSNNSGTGYLSGTAYAFNMQTEGAQDLQFGTNNSNRLIIHSTTGAATFSSSVASTNILLNRGGGQWNIIPSSGSNDLYFQESTGAQYAMTLFGTNAAVGINTISYAGYKLDVNGTARVSGAATFSNDVTTTGASQNLFIADGSTYSGFKLNRAGTAKWTIFNNNAGTDFLDFYWYGSSPGTKFKIEPTGAATFSSSVTAGGDVNIPNGNYYYAKRNTGSANINILGIANGTDTTTLKGGTSGATTSIIFADTGGDIARFFNGVLQANYGISFPTPSPASSGTVTSSVLDAYEEGTWTATMSGDGVGNTATGTYVRIGDLVYVQIYFSNITISNAGNAVLTGLPFSANVSTVIGYGILTYIHGTATLNCNGGYVSGTTVTNVLENNYVSPTWVTGSGKYGMWSGTYRIN